MRRNLNTMIKVVKAFCFLFGRKYFFHFIINKKIHNIHSFNIRNKKRFVVCIYYSKMKRKTVVLYEENGTDLSLL